MPETRAPRIEVDGQAADAALLGRLLDVRVDRRLNLTGSASIRCSGTQEGLPLKMGSKVDIKSPAGDPAFGGWVTSVEVERYDAQHRVTTYGLLDGACKLRQSSQAITRLHTKTSDVAADLASDAGLVFHLDPTDTKYDYLLQNGNDLDYLDGLLAREGLDWWCEGDTFYARRVDTGHVAPKRVKAVELERLSVRASAIRPDTVVVRGWSTAHDAVAGRKQLAADDLGATGTMADLALGAAGSVGRQEHSTASLPVIDAAEAQRLATAALVRSASTAVRAELEGPGLWGFGPGDVVEVVDGDDATGKYLVTEVQHRFADGVASSRVISGDRRPPAIDGGSGAVDPTSAVLHGIVVAQVTDLDDPDSKGRVRARFPGLDEKQESDWARVSSISAGAGRGSTVRPEVGDEVLMAFEGGDLRKPVILGSLYTSRTALPDLTLGKSGFERATMLHQFGHQILLWGKSGEEGFEVRMKSGTSLLMNQEETVLKGSDKQTTTTIKQGQSSIKLESNGTITIEGVKIVLKASGDLEVTGANVTVKGSTGTKVTGGTTLELSGGASTKVAASGVLEVKGAMVKIN